jgi:hypothetical protein
MPSAGVWERPKTRLTPVTRPAFAAVRRSSRVMVAYGRPSMPRNSGTPVCRAMRIAAPIASVSGGAHRRQERGRRSSDALAFAPNASARVRAYRVLALDAQRLVRPMRAFCIRRKLEYDDRRVYGVAFCSRPLRCPGRAAQSQRRGPLHGVGGGRSCVLTGTPGDLKDPRASRQGSNLLHGGRRRVPRRRKHFRTPRRLAVG